jgi:hypothetical protein
MIYCFFHDDHDGSCSAAIFMRWVNHYHNTEVKCISVNYNRDFPFDILKPGDDVCLVDFSMQRSGEWQKLLDITDKVSWIDHHKSAIEEAEKQGMSNLPGLRSADHAGCELTWMYCYGKGSPMPEVVRLVGDYDRWQFVFGERTKHFNSGLSTMIDTRPESDFWNKTLRVPKDNSYERDIDASIILAHKTVNKIVKIGKKLMAKSKISNTESLQNWGFEVEFCGHKCLAVNRNPCGSLFFESIGENYDILMPIVFDGKQWTVSLYCSGSEKSKGIDMSALASAQGGGGHFGAAGFQCQELPFKVLRKLSD